MEEIVVEKGDAPTVINIITTTTSVVTQTIDISDLISQRDAAQTEVDRINALIAQAGQAGVNIA